MNELERLKAERKRIDEKIKELKELANGNIDYKRCRIGRATGLPYDTSMVYKLAFNCETAGVRKIQKTNYRAIMYAEDKKTLIDAIPSIIEELQGLYELAVKQSEGNETEV